MTVEVILEEIRVLSVGERKRLISLIVDTLAAPETQPAPKKRSILEFEGVGAELWEGVDSQQYLDELRSEWDNHS